MKNDYEMYQSVLSKRSEHRKKKERQKSIVIHTVPVIACLCLTVGLGYWTYSKNPPSVPSPPNIVAEVLTTTDEMTSQASTVRTSSKTTVSATKTLKTTATETTKTEKEVTSVTETSISTETTEVNTTKTEPPTQNTTVIETTVTVTMTTQSSVITTVTTHDSSYTTTTSAKHEWYEDFPKVIINGVTYYYIGEDDGDNEFTTDEFLGFGTDFEGIFREDPTIRCYTIHEEKNAIIAVTEKGEQIPFFRFN